MVIENIIIYFAIFLFLYITILYLIVWWENKSQIYKLKLKKNYPNVCIIVPCFNEEKTIVKTVHSLLKLDYPKDKLEILVVDDGSTDKTFQKTKLLEKHKQVKIFHKKNGGKWTASNYGLSKTNAEFVGCLDADSFVNSQALKLIMPHFTSPKIMAVIPAIKIHQPKNILQQIQKIEYIFSIFLRKMLAFLDSVIITPGPFTIFRKKVFDELGLFRHAYNTEDLEIALRIQSKNYQIANAPNACVYTIGPALFRKLYQQRKRWYQGLLKNAWDYRHIFINKKYGDLGLFILPAMLLAIFTFIILSFWTMFQISQGIAHKITLWSLTGFSFNQINLGINWFFLNTNAYVFLMIIILSINILTILLGKKMSFEKSNIKKDFLFFILFYNPLFFIWWLSAIKNVILNKENKW